MSSRPTRLDFRRRRRGMASHMLRHLDSRRVRKTDRALLVQLLSAHFQVKLVGVLGVGFFVVALLSSTVGEFPGDGAEGEEGEGAEDDDEDEGDGLHSDCGEETCCSVLCLDL